MPAPTAASTAGTQATPNPATTSPIAPGPAMPPTEAAGKSHDVARASPGLSLASHTMPVGKTGARARPVITYGHGRRIPIHAATSDTTATLPPPSTMAESGT